MKLSLAIQTPDVEGHVPVSLLQGSLEQKLAKAAGLGADGVELITVDPSRLPLGRVRNCLRTNGLKVAAVSTGGLSFVSELTLLDADSQKADRAYRRLMEIVLFAEEVDARVVTIGSFRGRQGSGGARKRERLVGIFREMDSFATLHHVRLAIEPLNRYETDLINNVDEGLEFLEEVGRPSVGLLLDTFHVNIEECSWGDPFRRALRMGRLLHVHLGDNNRLAPGLGLIDFRSVVAALHEGGYTGFLSAELLPLPDPDEAARLALAHMRPLLAELA
jgi:sugar phosphate isomerase/epimerase